MKRWLSHHAICVTAEVAVRRRLVSSETLGVIWIRPDVMKRRLRVVVDQLAT